MMWTRLTRYAVLRRARVQAQAQATQARSLLLARTCRPSLRHFCRARQPASITCVVTTPCVAGVWHSVDARRKAAETALQAARAKYLEQRAVLDAADDLAIDAEVLLAGVATSGDDAGSGAGAHGRADGHAPLH